VTPPRDGRGLGLAWGQVATFGMVLFPAAVVFGHFEEMLALAFGLFATRALLEERWARAALLLGVAIAFKQWAVLAVPPFVVVAPPGLRLRVLRLALVLPVALVAVPLAVDWSHASLALFRPLSFPQLGHAALWIHRSATPIVGTPTRVAAVATAVGIALCLRRRRSAEAILAAVALALLARVWLEPVAFAYYLCPPLALLFLHERARGRTGARTVLLGCGWEAFFLLHPDPILWWSISALVTAWLASPAVAEVWRAATSGRVTVEAIALEPAAATRPIH